MQLGTTPYMRMEGGVGRPQLSQWSTRGPFWLKLPLIGIWIAHPPRPLGLSVSFCQAAQAAGANSSPGCSLLHRRVPPVSLSRTAQAASANSSPGCSLLHQRVLSVSLSQAAQAAGQRKQQPRRFASTTMSTRPHSSQSERPPGPREGSAAAEGGPGAGRLAQSPCGPPALRRCGPSRFGQ